jgi:DNA-directed RNA polymerase specialized sigma24 family protein
MINRKAQNELWGGAFARLVRIALAWTHNNADAQELAQEALLRVFAQSPEPPRELEQLVLRAAGIMKGRFLNRRRADRRRQDPRWIAAAAQLSRGLRRTPEDLAAAREQLARVLEGLQKDLKDDPLGGLVVEATLDGYDTAADQAEHLGKDIKEIRKARKRVSRAVKAIEAAEGGAQIGLDWESDESESLGESEREYSESGKGDEE